MKLLKFESSSCELCIQLDELMENMVFPYPVEKINIEENVDTAVKYVVRNTPTLILVDDSGVEIAREAGVVSATEIYKVFVENLL